MVIHVLDRSFKLVDVIDEFVSVIWRPAYYDIGDFELYINASSKAVAILKKNYYLVRDKDIEIDDSGNIAYKNVMIIKNFTLTTDAESGDYLTYTGKELKFLLHQRIVWRQTNLTGTAEAGIRRLVTENAISPQDTKRVIPMLKLGASAGLLDTINKQLTGEYLDETIVDICTAYNYGWDIYIYNSALIFSMYAGVNRSYSQTERPYVVFNDDFNNIINSQYELNSLEYANTALVVGEGEGTQRIYASVGDDNTGLDRYETFVDSSSISQNKDTEDEITLATYKTLLEESGTEALASMGLTEGFSGDVLSDVAFKLNEDFFIGDVVTVINRYGINRDVRILSIIESVDESGEVLTPQFNI